MNKKWFEIFTTLSLAFSIALSGCGSSPEHEHTFSSSPEHEHTFSSSYEYDETYHWHPSTCGHDVQGDKERHVFSSSITDPTYDHEGYTTYTCLICGYSYTDDETNALAITITWKNYDGTVLEVDENVPYGSMPSYDGPAPFKESDDTYNYSFSGWSPNVEIATKSSTYVATFSSQEITYTIDFDLNGGTSSSYRGPVEINTFSKDIFFFDCVKDGWSFRGWEYQNEKIFDEKGNQLKNVTLVDNMVFKAIYTQTVKLTIVSNISEAGTVTGAGEYPYNSYVDVSAIPNQGYEFIGWYYQGTLLSNTEDYKYMMWDQDITLEARFKFSSFTMHIYSNSEEHGLVLLRSDYNRDYLPEYLAQIKYENEVTIAAYSKTDVRFLGWYDENNQLVTRNAVYSFVMPNHDYTLEAKWNYFKINYNLNGGVNNENNPTSYSIDDDDIVLHEPARKGYTFIGWKYNGEFIDKIDTNTIHDYTLEAVWSTYEYTIKQDLDGNRYASIIGFDNSIAEVNIPSEIVVDSQTIPVKEIGNNAFEGNTTIISITIPDGVTSIGGHAFDGCSSLTSINIPDGVTSVGDYAFRGCSSLTIYCEAASKPSGWSSSWNYSGCPVVWSAIGGGTFARSCGALQAAERIMNLDMQSVQTGTVLKLQAIRDPAPTLSFRARSTLTARTFP